MRQQYYNFCLYYIYQIIYKPYKKIKKFFLEFISTCQRRMNEIITNTVVSLNNGTNKFNQELKEHKIICWKTNIDCNIAIEKLQKVITEKKRTG